MRAPQQNNFRKKKKEQAFLEVFITKAGGTGRDWASGPRSALKFCATGHLGPSHLTNFDDLSIFVLLPAEPLPRPTFGATADAGCAFLVKIARDKA